MPLPTVNDKQELFLQKFLQSGDKLAAYAEVYDVDLEKHRHYCVNRVNTMLKKPHIAHRYRELQKLMEKNGLLRLEDHVKELERLRDLAIQDGKYAAAVNAEVARGKATGLYVEKVECDQTLTIEIVKFTESPF